MNDIIYTVNIKQNMPTCADALEQLHVELAMAKLSDPPVIKIVHGYGSHGLGGKIRLAVQQELRRRKKTGEIRAFSIGEQWGPFDPDARRILAEFPAAAHDEDFARNNVGITVVMV